MTQAGQDEYETTDQFGGGEALQPFDVRDQTSKNGMVLLIGGFVALLILAFIVLKLFSSGTRDRDQAPRIHANNSPYKEVPLERGGVQTPNQDKEIYQKLNGEANHADPVTTIPVSEQPLEKPHGKPSVSTNGPKTGAVTPDELYKNRANIKIKESVDEYRETVTAPVKKAPATKPANTSAYVVQVASLRSAEEARKLWRKLQSSQKSVLRSSHFSDIKRVDLGDKGIYYRLRIAGLASKTAANDLCTRLKAAKQSCLVTKR